MPTDPSPSPSRSSAEARLRSRLSRYGAALEAAAADPAPPVRPHLVVVGPGAPPRPERPRVRAGILRVAAAVVVLALAAGAGWAATRPPSPGDTTTIRGGWADAEIVRPQDRRSALAALDGSWPLPTGASLQYVVDRSAGERPTFAAFRAELADAASCLWLRTAYDRPDLAPAERDAIAAMPSWPGHAEAPAAERTALRDLATAALAGDGDALRPHLAARCGGSGAALGRPEIGPYWLVAGGADGPAGPSGASSDVPTGGAARIVAADAIPGGAAIVERLAPAALDPALSLALPDGSYVLGFRLRGRAFSVTISRVAGPVTLPVGRAAFDRGAEVRPDGIEVFAGTIDGGAVAHVVGPGGRSLALSFAGSVEDAERAVGDLGDLAVDLHAAAWPS
jgi:hypothetical protein